MAEFIVNTTRINASQETEQGKITADIVMAGGRVTAFEGGTVGRDGGMKASFSANGGDLSVYFYNGTEAADRIAIHSAVEDFMADAAKAYAKE